MASENFSDDFEDLLIDIEGESDFSGDIEEEKEDEDIQSELDIKEDNREFDSKEQPVDDAKEIDSSEEISDVCTPMDEVDWDVASDEIETEEEPESESEEVPEISETVDISESGDDDEFLDENISLIEFTVKGSKSWNTREPYIAAVDNKKLINDYVNLKASVYYYHDTGKEIVIQKEIKDAIIHYYRNGSKGISGEYEEFINGTLSAQIQEMANTFQFQGDILNLFIYHLGVLSLYRILINKFEYSKLGYCYKLMSGNRVSKYIPHEFIKEKVLNWHENNLSVFDIPFDGINEFNGIKRKVSRKYYSEVDKFNEKLNEIINKSNYDARKDFNKAEFLKSKWINWFGIANMIAYNRFIERTIFK